MGAKEQRLHSGSAAQSQRELCRSATHGMGRPRRRLPVTLGKPCSRGVSTGVCECVRRGNAFSGRKRGGGQVGPLPACMCPGGFGMSEGCARRGRRLEAVAIVNCGTAARGIDEDLGQQPSDHGRHPPELGRMLSGVGRFACGGLEERAGALTLRPVAFVGTAWGF